MITEAEKKAIDESRSITAAKESLDTLEASLAVEACEKFKHLEGKGTFSLHVNRYVAVAFLKGSTHPEMLADANPKKPTPEVRVANKIMELRERLGEYATNTALLQTISELEYRKEAIKQIKEERMKAGTSKGGVAR